MALEPRFQHYRFAHVALRQILLSHWDEVFPDVAAGVANPAFIRVWEGAAPPDEKPLPPDGLSAKVIDVAGYSGILVVMPAVEGEAEAHLCLGVKAPTPGQDADIRFFTLEHGISPLSGDTYTVLGEWTKQGHLNLGSGPPPEPEGFISSVGVLLHKAT